LAETGELSREDARDLFFAFCLSKLIPDSTPLSDFHPSRLLEVLQAQGRAAVGFVERIAHVMPRYTALLSELVSRVCDVARGEPLVLGWAYQIWNEEERARSTWAVSRRGETSPLHISVAAATQLFTEEYMTRFLIGRSFGKDSPEVCELFDPACGAGHFLVEGVRNVYARTGSAKAVTDFVCERLFGVDIDPYAVELCRVIVWLEAIRYEPNAAERTWRALQSAIRPVASEFGSLDRRSTEPLLNRAYRCIATNPPYLGRRKLTEQMRAFLDTEYPDAAADLCAAFMQRCVELLAPMGSLALVTVDKWLRLSSYDGLRNGGHSFPGLYHALSIDLLCELGDGAFRRELGLHDGVRILLTTARRLPPPDDHRLTVLDIAGCSGPSEKAAALLEFDSNGSASLVRSLAQRDLRDRHSPTEFYLSKLPRTLQCSGRTVSDSAEVVVGLQTNDDRRLVRFHWEVVPDPERWRVHSKGGGYGRWFGLNRYLLDWSTGRPEFERNPRSGLRVEPFFERSGWTYTWFANGSLGLRQKDEGWSFGRAAAAGFFCDDERVVAFLNSRFGSLGARRVGGKIQLPEGIVRKLPIPRDLDFIDPRLVSAAAAIKRALVSHDPTDVTFQPEIRETPQVLLSLEVLLLLVEDELEQQVERCVKCSPSERDDVESIFGVPVGRMPCGRYGIESTQYLWGTIPERFHWIKELLQSPRSTEEVPQIDEDEVVSALMQRSSRRKTKTSLPSDTRLEFLCRSNALHPLDVYDLILRKCGTCLTFSRAFFLPYITDEILLGVAEALGHRWWNQSAHSTRIEGQRIEIRGVVTLDTMTQHVHARLLDRADIFGGFSIEELLGYRLDVWLRERFLEWHTSRLLQRPLVLGDVSGSGVTQGFKHVWDGI
jgi:hypothetical protein